MTTNYIIGLTQDGAVETTLHHTVEYTGDISGAKAFADSEFAGVRHFVESNRDFDEIQIHRNDADQPLDAETLVAFRLIDGESWS